MTIFRSPHTLPLRLQVTMPATAARPSTPPDIPKPITKLLVLEVGGAIAALGSDFEGLAIKGAGGVNPGHVELAHESKSC